MDKFFHFGRNVCTGCREDVGVFKSHCLSYKAQYGLVYKLIFKGEPKRRTLGMAKIVDIVFVSYRQGIGEHLLLYGTRTVYLVFDSLVHLFPEPWYRRHTCRMCFTHGLLYFLRIGVDDNLSSYRQAQICPSAFEDMGERQEADGLVCIVYRYTLAVGFKSGIILSVGQYHTLRVTCRAACIQYVAYIVERSLFPQFLHLCLSGQSFTEFQEIGEIYGVGVVCTEPYTFVEHDDAFERRT